MRQLLIIVFLLSNITVFAQENKKNLFKSIYDDFFKYSTFYVAGDIQNPKEEVKDYFVRTNPDGGLYDIPVVTDGTDYYDFDYRYGFGVRKLDRFDYEFFAVRDLINNRDNSLSCFKQALKSFLIIKLN